MRNLPHNPNYGFPYGPGVGTPPQYQRPMPPYVMGNPGVQFPSHPGMRPPFSSPIVRQISDVERLHQKLVAAGLEQTTTVWVGKISPLVEDSTVKKLLDACGAVQSWSRVEANGQLKSFGFCHFQSPEGALRSLRILDNLKLADENLKLRVDANTTKYLEEYEKKKDQFLETEKAECAKLGKPLLQLPFTDRTEKDKVAIEIIDTIRDGIERALAEDGEGDGVVSREIRNFREKQAKAEREKRDREEESERKRREQEEEEQKREARRRERLEHDFSIKEADWIDHEQESTRQRSKYKQDIVELRTRRRKNIELDDDDDKLRRRIIRSRENKKKRQREKEEDDRERERENFILAEIARKEQAKREAEEKLRKIEEQKKMAAAEAEAAAQRMLMEVKMEVKQEEKAMFRIVENIQEPAKEESAKLFSVAFKSSKRNVSEVTKTLGFSDEPEEDSLVPKKRRLQTLEKEMYAKMGAEVHPKNVVDQIPIEIEELFAFKIDWKIVDKNDIVEDKMRPWVTKKITEFLGEEEPTLIEYICKKLVDHSPPQDILDQLQLVLDDEATTFVIKMWRMLIYNMLTTSSSF